MHYIVLFILLLFATSSFAQVSDGAKPAGETDPLLEELGGELPAGLEDLLPPLPAEKKEPNPGENPSSEGLPNFEPPQKSADPLVDIGQRMRTVEEQIARNDTSESTQAMQRKIVADIDVLLEQLKKQCQSSEKKPGSGKATGGAGGGNQATQQAGLPTESTDRVGESEEQKAELGRLDDLVKEIWGHLPDRMRNDVQSSTSDEVLPEYENLIEEYFRSLAKRPRSGS